MLYLKGGETLQEKSMIGYNTEHDKASNWPSGKDDYDWEDSN